VLHGDLSATRVGLLVPKRRANNKIYTGEREKSSKRRLRETKIYISWRNGGFAGSRFVSPSWLYWWWSATKLLEYVEAVARSLYSFECCIYGML
jgi:hypothetical protein